MRDYTAEYEEMAKQFYEDTGLMAPGKSVSTAAANDPSYNSDLRRRKWYEWLEARNSKKEE